MGRTFVKYIKSSNMQNIKYDATNPKINNSIEKCKKKHVEGIKINGQ